MHFSTKIKFKPFQYVVVLCLFFFIAFSDPRTTESGLICGENTTVDPNYIPNFVEEMHSLSLNITSRRFITHSINTTPFNITKTTPIFGLIQCHNDLSPSNCQLCYAFARTRLPRCLPSTAARIFLDGCFLRYDTYKFYDESVSVTSDSFSCSNDTVSDPRFENRVDRVSRIAVRAASGGGGFGVAGESGVYALGQCWENVGKEECRVCLEKAVREVKRCVLSKEGRGMNAGCYFRYSTHKFYNNGPHGKINWIHKKGVIVAIVLSTSALVMLILLAIYAIIIKTSRTKQEERTLGIISKRFKNSKTKFKYEVLEKATDYFSKKRQLGEGGNGAVFLGILPNGNKIAVKRLVFNTREWVEEFFNEVNLISGIQHKNLVKLIGCSIEGPESLLVYEFIHNRSLDHFIFDESKRKALNWKQRLNIILGTAEGLAYLHGGFESPITIIHRDIKPSNVLLDDQFCPKIADFGLIRCFGPDKTHLSTGIAGTLGYMAPEYVIQGQLTEKADVYSFGVLVLEIVCGTRNNVCVPESGHLLQKVWKLYTQNRLVESLDPCLKEELNQEQEVENEVYRVLCIGLLCAQASPLLRPSMEEVIKMLSKRDYILPNPTNPPFLSINSSLIIDQSMSSSNNSSMISNSNVKNHDQGSCSSSESCINRRN